MPEEVDDEGSYEARSNLPGAIAAALSGLFNTVGSANKMTEIAAALSGLFNTVGSTNPAWEQTVFRVLHELDMADAEPSTWWLELPLQVRTGVIVFVVWTYIFALLSTLSLEHQAEAAMLRENTGLNPVEVAAAAACMASMVYRHFARPDES